MTVAVYTLICLGSVLMVYNICCFVRFAHKVKDNHLKTENGILSIPIVLLALFLAGYVAVDMFNASAPGHYDDAILMDLRMPVMDWLAAASAIRALDRPDSKMVPIIAMTANVFDEDVENSLKAGMNAHLAKSIEPDRLYSKLAELISGGEK